MLKKIIITFLLAAFTSGFTLTLIHSGYLDKPEFMAYDLLAKKLRTERASNTQIKVILVDEASLKAMSPELGGWPWPRAIWADVLDFLSMGGPRAVLFDILYLEPKDEANDLALVEATGASRNVFHSMIIRQEKPDPDALSTEGLNRAMPAEFISRFALHKVAVSALQAGSSNNEFTLPIPGLAEASKGIAVVEFKPDPDGVYRRTHPLREYQGSYFPILGLSPFIDGNTPISINRDSISINDRTIPVDEEGNYLINMYGLDKVETYSMSGILASYLKIKKGEIEDLLVNPELFKDSIVFIAVSAIAGADLKPIPVAPKATPAVPGVMLHAFLANNYLKNDFMSPPRRGMTMFSSILAAFLTAIFVMFTPRFSLRLILPLMMMGLYLGYAIYAFHANHHVAVVPLLFSITTTGFLSFGYLTFTEAVDKKRVSNLFSQYVSKDVLNEVLHNYKEYLKTGTGQKAEITVLFSDIRGFTTMSESTPPEKIVEMLNIHFTVMADVILKHNGTIDKYIGDAIMAFWGAPVRTADHARQAVDAAKEMLEKLPEVNRLLHEQGFAAEIKIGIGINTGEATIGNIGSDRKKNYTIVGDTVNLASRLESITKEHNTPLVFSEYTCAGLDNDPDCQLLDSVRVKGREQPVTIYTLESIGKSSPSS